MAAGMLILAVEMETESELKAILQGHILICGFLFYR